MDPPASPPKRMTRARAAAKASTATTSASRAKSSSATAKAKSTRSTATVTTTSSAAKRKAQTEDTETDVEEDELLLERQKSTMNKPTRGRGRPKKTATEEPEAAAAAPAPAPAAKPHRGRPKKTATTESSHTSTATRATRTRKTAHHTDETTDDEGAVSDAPTKKTSTRTRTKTTTTAAASGAPTIAVRTAAANLAAHPAAKAAGPKKKVTFEEPEKENIAPKTTATKGKSTAASKTTESAAGLRAKPIRRAATGTAAKATATTARSTRAASTGRGAAAAAHAGKAAHASKKHPQPAPLSPKKVTQVRMARDDVESEDELGAMDINQAYIKPLSRTPSKPVATRGAQERTKRLAGAGLDLESATRDIGDSSESTEIHAEPSEPGCGIRASPARRPPASPAKEGLMGSPARRLDGIVTLDAPTFVANPMTDKVSLLFSPAKRFPMPVKSIGSLEDTSRSPLKTSLLQTPAKRPISPMKAAFLLKRPDMKPARAPAVIAEADETADMTGLSATPAASEAADFSDSDSDDEVEVDTESLTQMLSDMASDAAKMVPDSPTRAKFHARPTRTTLSRGMSPAVASPAVTNEANNAVTVCEAVMPAEDLMEIDMLAVEVPHVASTKKSPAKPKFIAPLGAFGLRARDLDVCEMEIDSEDEQTTRIMPLQEQSTFVSTPRVTGKRRSSRTPSSRGSRDSHDGRGAVKRLRLSKAGFTPLAEQLSIWKAHSPEEVSVVAVSPTAQTDIAEDVNVQEPELEQAAASPSLFMQAVHNSTPVSPIEEHEEEQEKEQEQEQEQEHEHKPEHQPEQEQESEHEPEYGQTVSTEVLRPIFDKVDVTEEDLELVEEANDMSLMEREQAKDLTQQTSNHDDSDDSEEYGDENAIPIDPALMEEEHGAPTYSPGVPPVTPQRVMKREFHTVSKVPLKAADESTPRPVMRRRSLSMSRMSPSRRQSRRQSRRDSFSGVEAVDDMVSDEEREIVRSLSNSPALNSPAPVTPAKSEGGWSMMGTPARTPRRDIDPALLRGAVVFVDVHTTDGADASGIFVELLTQMGARCVPSWNWVPSSAPNEQEGESSKIGITHVVFKDGGKQTLEKVRESSGVVQCVGVSWVLDCERENEWVDESPYYIDTSMVPRGGARRRKSMDPRALAKANGMASTPVRQTLTTASVNQRACYTAPMTPTNRQQSVTWAQTPEAGGQGIYADGSILDDDENGENSWMLTAVPKTPAPEAIARYAEEITAASSPMSSVGGDENSEGDDTMMSMGFGGSSLLMRTCPPQKKFYELGPDVLSQEKDQGVLMRLLSARRKSLQFAPKIGSPLSKAWN